MRVHFFRGQDRGLQQWRTILSAIIGVVVLLFLLTNGFFLVRYKIRQHFQAKEAEKYKDFVQVAIVSLEQEPAISALLGKAGISTVRGDGIPPEYKQFRIRVAPAEEEQARQALTQYTVPKLRLR